MLLGLEYSNLASLGFGLGLRLWPSGLHMLGQHQLKPTEVGSLVTSRGLVDEIVQIPFELADW